MMRVPLRLSRFEGYVFGWRFLVIDRHGGIIWFSAVYV